MGQDFDKLQRSMALFLLRIKDKHKVSQGTIDDIVHHSREVADDIIARVKTGVFSKLLMLEYIMRKLRAWMMFSLNFMIHSKVLTLVINKRSTTKRP